MYFALTKSKKTRETSSAEKQAEGLGRISGSLKATARLPGRAPAWGAELPADAFCTRNPTPDSVGWQELRTGQKTLPDRGGGPSAVCSQEQGGTGEQGPPGRCSRHPHPAASPREHGSQRLAHPDRLPGPGQPRGSGDYQRHLVRAPAGSGGRILGATLEPNAAGCTQPGRGPQPLP